MSGRRAQSRGRSRRSSAAITAEMQERVRLRAVFVDYMGQKDARGMTPVLLREMCRRYGYEISEVVAERMVGAADEEGRGYIKAVEFAASLQAARADSSWGKLRVKILGPDELNEFRGYDEDDSDDDGDDAELIKASPYAPPSFTKPPAPRPAAPPVPSLPSRPVAPPPPPPPPPQSPLRPSPAALAAERMREQNRKEQERKEQERKEQERKEQERKEQERRAEEQEMIDAMLARSLVYSPQDEPFRPRKRRGSIHRRATEEPSRSGGASRPILGDSDTDTDTDASETRVPVAQTTAPRWPSTRRPLQRASLLQRLAVDFADFAVVALGAVAIFVYGLLAGLEDPARWPTFVPDLVRNFVLSSHVPLLNVSVSVLAASYILLGVIGLVVLPGKTPGQALLGLRTVEEDSSDAAGCLQLWCARDVRTFASLSTFGLLYILDIFTLLVTQDRRSFCDWFVGVEVVNDT